MEGKPSNKSESMFEGNEWTFETTKNTVERASNAFEKKLIKNGWSPEEAEDLSLGFIEAVTNAVVHGNLGIVKPKDNSKTTGGLMIEELKKHPEKKNKKVQVIFLEINKDKVSVKIIDEGAGFNQEEVPDPTLPENLLKPKGRGLFMMRAYFGSVTYNEKGNEVTLVKERKTE
ncbi:MAG: ATP-binding protein [Candidatus Paceibacterota bacterium]